MGKTTVGTHTVMNVGYPSDISSNGTAELRFRNILPIT